MSGWKVHYRDRYDQDRISSEISSREAALKLANDLRYQRSYLYKVEDPNGLTLPQEQVSAWSSDHKWLLSKFAPESDYL